MIQTTIGFLHRTISKVFMAGPILIVDDDPVQRRLLEDARDQIRL